MKPRLSAYLSDHVAERLALAAKRPGANKSAIVDKALDKFLSQERDQGNDAALLRRLDRMSKQLAQIDRHQLIVLESLALFIRYYLTITPPLPRSERPSSALHYLERSCSHSIHQIGEAFESLKSCTTPIASRQPRA